jgi:hypothetical protein
MTKTRSLVKNRRTVKHRKNRRTVKHRKNRRTVKHRRYGGDPELTEEEKNPIFDEFMELSGKLQFSMEANQDALYTIIEFYTFVIYNANPILKIKGVREFLVDKIIHLIEEKESVWYEGPNPDFTNKNLLKQDYLQKKSELLPLIANYNRLYP